MLYVGCCRLIHPLALGEAMTPTIPTGPIIQVDWLYLQHDPYHGPTLGLWCREAHNSIELIRVESEGAHYKTILTYPGYVALPQDNREQFCEQWIDKLKTLNTFS